MAQAFQITPTDALVVVDVQNDFCPGGALAVPEGDQVVPILNQYLARFSAAGATIIATRDWHPPRHVSFQEFGGPWPVHCVQGSKGAEFCPGLKLPPDCWVVSKADREEEEAYSPFQGTNMSEDLRARGIQRLFVGGLATDYCVRATVLDARQEGFEVVVLRDAIRGVEVNPGDSEKALQEMLAAGALLATSRDLAEG